MYLGTSVSTKSRRIRSQEFLGFTNSNTKRQNKYKKKIIIKLQIPLILKICYSLYFEMKKNIYFQDHLCVQGFHFCTYNLRPLRLNGCIVVIFKK